MDSYHTTQGSVKGSSSFEGDLFGHIPDAVSPRYPKVPGFKVGGTSAEAAQRIAPLAGRLFKPILQEFMAAGQRGLTADQCAARIGVSILVRCWPPYWRLTKRASYVLGRRQAGGLNCRNQKCRATLYPLRPGPADWASPRKVMS